MKSLLFFFLFAACAALAAPATNAPLPSNDLISRLAMPPGFHATVFAHEPDVVQPIAMTFDDRGRLWVIENLSYTATGEDMFDTNRHDRIVIFEDTNGDGIFDKRIVFWDKGERLTGIALGFGGVFCASAPNLIFIPDTNHDDVPDGPPQILLEGWNAEHMHHTIFNGLKWGPDGWLYGREGIVANSYVGLPGSPVETRAKLNGAIWRYHPTRHIFEVVCEGTTNPWGTDWDDMGEMFFVNTVIGHLWHAVPGAVFKRMFGDPIHPYAYGLLDQTADHYHWNTGHSWVDARGVGDSDSLGGGHAHAGLMIYQGDNWPVDYRGHVFMLNFHGRRINQDLLERKGSTYVAHHGTDIFKFGDSWFQGIDLDYGPDGAVTVLDWSDTGECHGANGVHTNTGRIYKLAYGTNSLPFTNDLGRLSIEDLIQLQFHNNEWFARHARRILQERNAPVVPQLQTLYASQTNIALKLRFLFALHAVKGDTHDWLLEQLGDADEHVRAWAVRFLNEAPDVNWFSLTPRLVSLAQGDPSELVRLYLASALQRMPKAQRAPLAAALVQHAEDITDPDLPLMEWFGIEPMVAAYPEDAIALARVSKIPLLRNYIARRLAEEIARDPRSIEKLFSMTEHLEEEQRDDVFHGVLDAWTAQSHLQAPHIWPALRDELDASGDGGHLWTALQLGARFADPWALQRLEKIETNPQVPDDNRRDALKQLVVAQPTNLTSILDHALSEKATAAVAAHALLAAGNVAVAAKSLQQWEAFGAEDRAQLIAAIISRASTAALLLEAIGRGLVPRGVLNAYHAREIGNFNDPRLTQRLREVWGEVHSSDAEKTAAMARFKAVLTTDRLKKADLSLGREVFSHTCAVCHKLYGEGAAIAPDLTGGGRANLDYLLENIIDPSAIVPTDYRVSEVELKDGRSLSALIVSRTEHGVTLQTPTERITVENDQIVSQRQTTLSLMPEGLLQGMKPDDVANLIAYLMAPMQVPLPTRPK